MINVFLKIVRQMSDRTNWINLMVFGHLQSVFIRFYPIWIRRMGVCPLHEILVGGTRYSSFICYLLLVTMLAIFFLFFFLFSLFFFWEYKHRAFLYSKSGFSLMSLFLFCFVVSFFLYFNTFDMNFLNRILMRKVFNIKYIHKIFFIILYSMLPVILRRFLVVLPNAIHQIFLVVLYKNFSCPSWLFSWPQNLPRLQRCIAENSRKEIINCGKKFYR